jgi:putative phosphoesterase
VLRVHQIGLISDTHGLLREEAVAALRGSELILHAGDVGDPQILPRLRELAPVLAVRGNIDTAEWSNSLPDAQVVETEAATIYLLHDLNQLDIDPAGSGFQFVVSGHSHKPERVARRGVVYLNPGSAGPRRFHLPISLARLDLGVSPWSVEFIKLG